MVHFLPYWLTPVLLVHVCPLSDLAGSCHDHPGIAQARWKKIALIGGLVLPVWDVIQKSLGSMKRTSEQRLHVVRILTTGASSARYEKVLIGLRCPSRSLLQQRCAQRSCS